MASVPETENIRPAASGNGSGKRRRSHRVVIAIPVLVRGSDAGGQLFLEETTTITVSAQGCLISLAAEVCRDAPLTIVNIRTNEEVPCRVLYLGNKQNNEIEVGVAFAVSSPQFWNITFPPDDWDPSERKRPEVARPLTK